MPCAPAKLALVMSHSNRRDCVVVVLVVFLSHLRASCTMPFLSQAEVYQSYGSHKTSTHFFLYYGFIPSGYVRSDYIAFRVRI